MTEREDLPDIRLGPIQENEKERILDGVDELLENAVYVPDSPLPQAPSNLVRRFWFERPTDPTEDPSWIPWEKMPDGLCGRASAAGDCKRKIYQFAFDTKDREADEFTLTPESIRGVVDDLQRWRADRWHPDRIPRMVTPLYSFDLHDVYVCIEADLLADYHEMDNFQFGDDALQALNAAIEWEMGWKGTILENIGRAIEGEV